MPQLVPFYFMHHLTFGILGIFTLVYLSSSFILPNLLRLLVARTIITKL